MLRRFKSKILVPTIIVMTVVLALVVLYASIAVRNLTDELAEERASLISKATQLRLEELSALSALATQLVSQSEFITNILLTYDTAAAVSDRTAFFQYVEGRRLEIGVGNLLVLDNQGYVFLRTNIPGTYGDNMGGGANVQAGMRGETISVFGVGALAIRMSLSTYTPIMSDGEQIGVFIARIIMNSNEFVDSFAEVFDSHVVIHTGAEVVATTILDAAGNRALGGYAPDHITETVLGRNEVFTGMKQIDDAPHHVHVFPVHNVAGNPIGMFFVAFSHERTRAATMMQQINMILIGIVGLILAGTVMFLYAMKLLKPLNLLTENLHEIATGKADLTKRLPIHGQDEIALASSYFNQTIDEFRKLIVAIKQQAGDLSEITSDLASNMTDTASAINQIASNIQNTKNKVQSQNASVVQTNTSMEHVTANINKLNGQVERQTSAVSQSSSAIQQMLANIQSVNATLARNVTNVKNLQESSDTGRNSLQEVADDIQEIARESESLLEINSVMENIASQTNLLSMNAAIEAAHAGDAGKGFAVVADEIRKLAESSGEQSKTIGNVLKKMKEGMDKISRSTDNVLNRFEAIDSGVRTVAEQEEYIRSAMEEQTQGSKLVLEAAGQVGEITQQVKDGSQEMFEESKGVIQESRNLEQVTLEITTGINEMASGAEQVNKAVTTVNGLTNKTQEDIASLVRAVSQFKI